MSYARMIKPLVSASTDPRHVEAWMRSEFGTLDHLSRDQFAVAVATSIGCIEQGGAAMSEQLAQSYGL